MKKSMKWIAMLMIVTLMASVAPIASLEEEVAAPTDVIETIENVQAQPEEEPIVEEPIVEEPIVEEPIVEEPIVEEPVVEEPIAEVEPTDETEVVIEDSDVPTSDGIEEAAHDSEMSAEERLMATIIDALDADRHIEIYAVWDGELKLGDIVTLRAKMIGYDNVVYSLQWQTSPDNVHWTNIAGATGSTYTLRIDESNYCDYWRVMLCVTDVVNAVENAQ